MFSSAIICLLFSRESFISIYQLFNEFKASVFCSVFYCLKYLKVCLSHRLLKFIFNLTQNQLKNNLFVIPIKGFQINSNLANASKFNLVIYCTLNCVYENMCGIVKICLLLAFIGTQTQLYILKAVPQTECNKELVFAQVVCISFEFFKTSKLCLSLLINIANSCFAMEIAPYSIKSIQRFPTTHSKIPSIGPKDSVI